MAEVEMDGSRLDGMMEAMEEYRRKYMCRVEENKVVKVGVEWEGLSGSEKRKGWKCTVGVVWWKWLYGGLPC